MTTLMSLGRQAGVGPAESGSGRVRAADAAWPQQLASGGLALHLSARRGGKVEA